MSTLLSLSYSTVTATTFYPEQNCVHFAQEFLRLRDNDTRPLKDIQISKLRREMSRKWSLSSLTARNSSDNNTISWIEY